MFPNFNFNSSHHGDYVGITSEPVCLVGLDIISDAIPRQEAALEFVKNFSSYFTALEWTKIVNADTPDEILANFYRYWCLKEAFVKAVGAGLGFGLRRLEFHHTNWSDISIYIDGVESRDWRFQLFEVDKRHWASLAIRHPQAAVGSDKRTVAEVKFEEAEEFLRNDPLPDRGGFILCSVDELISVSNRVQSVPCSGFSAS